MFNDGQVKSHKRIKNDKLNAEFAKRIGECISTELSDSRLHDGLLSIVLVEVDPDLTLAQVYYSLIANKNPIKEIEKALISAKGKIKAYLIKTMKLRRMPDLRFRYTEGIEHAIKISQIIKSEHENGQTEK